MLSIVPKALQPIVSHPSCVFRGSSSIRKVMPSGKPIQGNSSPMAAAAFGANEEVRAGIGGIAGIAADGTAIASGAAFGVAPSGCPLTARNGRPHCQQDGETGKLLAPQYKQRIRPGSSPSSASDSVLDIYLKFGSADGTALSFSVTG